MGTMLFRMDQPVELVREIVYNLPEELFQSDSTTFLDPAMGKGDYLVGIAQRLKEYGHSKENILSRLYGFECNEMYVQNCIHRTPLAGANITIKTYEEVLEWTPDMGMKFDVVIGNPPYTQLRYVEGDMQAVRRWAKQQGASSKSLKMSDVMVHKSFEWSSGVSSWLVPDWVQDFNQTPSISYIDYRSSTRDVFVSNGVGQKVVVLVYGSDGYTFVGDGGIETFNTADDLWTRYQQELGVVREFPDQTKVLAGKLSKLSQHASQYFSVEDGISSSGNKPAMVLACDDDRLAEIEDTALVPYADPSDIIAGGFTTPRKVTIIPMNDEPNATAYCNQHQHRKISHDKVRRWMEATPAAYIGWNMEPHNIRAGYRRDGGIVANTGSIFMLRERDNGNKLWGMVQLLNTSIARAYMEVNYPRLKSNTKCLVLSKGLLETFPVDGAVLDMLAAADAVDTESILEQYLDNISIEAHENP